jgi:chromosome segregation ATPase
MKPIIDSSKDRISVAAAEGERLLSVIAATEDTAATLSQVKLDLAALKNIWYDADALYSELSARLEKEQKEFEDLRGSHIKKFFAGSQYKEKLNKEENDVTEVQEWLAKADKTRKELKAKLDDMKERRQKLEHMLEQRVQALNDLDHLYAVVFDGPSPDNAEEDKLEAEMIAAQQVIAKITFYRFVHGMTLILSRYLIPYRNATAKWLQWSTISQWLAHASPSPPEAQQRRSKSPNRISLI